jgi:hypothetical protein
MEELEEGYAYQIMALEMEVENKGTDNGKIQSISRLLQLYMVTHCPLRWVFKY